VLLQNAKPPDRQIHNAFQTAVALAEWESRSNVAKGKGDCVPKELVLRKKHFKRVAEVSEGFDQYMTDLMGGRDESEMAASNWQRYDFRPGKWREEKEKKKKAESESEGSESSDDEEPRRKERTKDSDDNSDDSGDSDEPKKMLKEKDKKKTKSKSKSKTRGSGSD
jgi:hypothetical protein